MKVYTHIKVLKEAWRILKELNLHSLLTGKKLELDLTELLDQLLESGKLNEFCQTITQTDNDFEGEEYQFSEIRKLISDFFVGIVGNSKIFNGLKMEPKIPKTSELKK